MLSRNSLSFLSMASIDAAAASSASSPDFSSGSEEPNSPHSDDALWYRHEEAADDEDRVLIEAAQ